LFAGFGGAIKRARIKISRHGKSPAWTERKKRAKKSRSNVSWNGFLVLHNRYTATPGFPGALPHKQIA
jgi:hypothetical protein